MLRRCSSNLAGVRLRAARVRHAASRTFQVPPSPIRGQHDPHQCREQPVQVGIVHRGDHGLPPTRRVGAGARSWARAARGTRIRCPRRIVAMSPASARA
jgi:hypothetical protein